MGEPDEGRRALAAEYLRGRTLKEVWAAWRSDYDAPTYSEGRARLARLGNMIRRLAAEAEGEAMGDEPKRPRYRRPPHSTATPS